MKETLRNYQARQRVEDVYYRSYGHEGQVFPKRKPDPPKTVDPRTAAIIKERDGLIFLKRLLGEKEVDVRISDYSAALIEIEEQERKALKNTVYMDFRRKPRPKDIIGAGAREDLASCKPYY